MSKKDYILIANAINTVVMKDARNVIHLDNASLHALVDSLKRALSLDNPRFSVDTFEKACYRLLTF